MPDSRLIVRFDPSEIESTNQYSLETSGRVEASGNGLVFDFAGKSIFKSNKLLPPVCRYVSPGSNVTDFMLIERKPFVADNIAVPWNYFLVAVDKKNDSYHICWFFRPDKLYTSDDELYPTWLSKTLFDPGVDLLEFCRANEIPSDWPNKDILRNTQHAQDQLLALLKQDEQTLGAQLYKSLYQVDSLFSEQMQGKDIRYALEHLPVLEPDQLLTIDKVHTYAVDKAVESVMTFSELIQSELMLKPKQNEG